MKEMLKAAPVLSALLGVPPDMVRAHIKYRVGDIGRYCFMLDKKETGKTGGGNVIEKRKMITKDE